MTSDRIPVQSITMTMLEGPNAGERITIEHSRKAWDLANATLTRWAADVEHNEGYDKCEVVVVWDDGECYKLRYDLHQNEKTKLKKRIWDGLTYFSGVRSIDQFPTAADYRTYRRDITGMTTARERVGMTRMLLHHDVVPASVKPGMLAAMTADLRTM